MANETQASSGTTTPPDEAEVEKAPKGLWSPFVRFYREVLEDLKFNNGGPTWNREDVFVFVFVCLGLCGGEGWQEPETFRESPGARRLATGARRPPPGVRRPTSTAHTSCGAVQPRGSPASWQSSPSSPGAVQPRAEASWTGARLLGRPRAGMSGADRKAWAGQAWIGQKSMWTPDGQTVGFGKK